MRKEYNFIYYRDFEKHQNIMNSRTPLPDSFYEINSALVQVNIGK